MNHREKIYAIPDWVSLKLFYYYCIANYLQEVGSRKYSTNAPDLG